MNRLIRDAGYVEMPFVVPEGQVGDFSVQHFEVDEKEAKFSRMRMAITGSRDEEVGVGKYARLMHNQCLVMSDTYMEQRTNLGILHRARGDVLIAGLGLGMVLVPVLVNKDVTSVLVIEKYPEVIELVEKPVRDYLGVDAFNKLTVIQADILEWKPPKGLKFDVAYFDIWNDVCTDNLEEVTKLKRRFAKRLRRNGKHWMGAWQEDWLRYLRRQGR